MKRLLLLFLVLCLALCSCDKESVEADNVLNNIIENEKALPVGQIYRKGAEEGKDDYLSGNMIGILYGVKAESEYFSMLEDYAIYLSSFAKPFEVAVFKCYSKSDVDSISKLCFLRGDIIKSLINHEKGNEDISVKVISKGRYVCMYVGTDPEGAERAFMNKVG